MSHQLSIPQPPTAARRPPVQAAARTHPGRVRRHNEDSHALLPHHGLYMLADGMGGRACGEVASCLVIEHVRRAFEDSDTTWPTSTPKPPRDRGLPFLVAALQRANAMLRNLVSHEDWRRGTGTTFAGLLLLDDRAAIAHVGDSRIYRYRAGRLDLLTEDHSLTNEYIRAGLLDPSEVATFAYRHVLSRAVTGDETIEVDTCCVAVLPGDTFLLSSDGLHALVDDRTITACLLVEPDLDRAAGDLVKLANDAGGTDNITVILVRASSPPR